MIDNIEKARELLEKERTKNGKNIY